jgi:hypothetical protein
MHRLLRFVLLAMGCVVMVATSPIEPPFGPQSLSIQLRPGTAVTVHFAAGRMEKDEPVERLVPRVYLRGSSLGNGAGARLVGILSTAMPRPEAYARVDPRGTFTVGQEVEGLGTVAFVREVPFDTHAEGPWVLPGAEDYQLTVFAQNAELSLELSMDDEAMRSQCGCEVGYGFDEFWQQFPLFDPDGGVSDGGVSGRDGG